MIPIREIVAGVCAGVIGYTYFGYPALLWCLKQFKPQPSYRGNVTPPVTVVLAVFNEELWIENTLRSILDSDYPGELLDVLIVSDASTDRTEEIIEGLASPRVRLIRQSARSGKRACLARAYPETNREVLVLTDAGTTFRPNTVRQLVRRFSDPRVGSVVGSRRIQCTGSAVSRGDKLYWQYETMLRSLEDATGACWTGCEGALFAIRRNLYSAEFKGDLAEDSVACYRVFSQGYLNRFDASAVIDEHASKDLTEEWHRKIRVITRGIRAMLAHRELFSLQGGLMFTFQNFSHRLLRWVLPFFIMALWIATAQDPVLGMRILFYSQTVFYGFGAAGILLRINGETGPTPLPLAVPAYFMTVNLSSVCAWFLLPKRFDIWKRTERAEENQPSDRRIPSWKSGLVNAPTVHDVYAAASARRPQKVFLLPVGKAILGHDGALRVHLSVLPMSGQLRIPGLQPLHLCLKAT